MSTLEVNTLIIGAGPAGSACSISLLKAGVDCLLVDKARFPRVKLCGGLFTSKSQACLHDLLGDEVYKDCMQVVTCSRENDLVMWRGQQPLIRTHLPKPIVLIDRPKLDNYLVDHYRRSGGKLIEDDGLKSIDFQAHQATLTSGQIIHYKHLVAADGCNSRVRHLLEASDPALHIPQQSVTSLEINVDRADYAEAKDVNIYFDVVPHSYAWSFSKGDKVCLGLIRMPGQDFDLQQRFTEFLQQLGVRNLNKYPLKGAMLPYCKSFDSVDSLALTFAGDAANLVEPMTFEGIFYALQSGVYAAQSIAEGRNYSQLLRPLVKTIGRAGFYQNLILGSDFMMRIVYRCAHKSDRFIARYYSQNIDLLPTESFFKQAARIIYKFAKHRIVPN